MEIVDHRSCGSESRPHEHVQVCYTLLYIVLIVFIEFCNSRILGNVFNFTIAIN